jgi:hypothetical protein
MAWPDWMSDNFTMMTGLFATALSAVTALSETLMVIFGALSGPLKTMMGDNLQGKIDITNEQDSQVNLQCMQQSIQQTNIGNEIASAIMQQMTQSVDQSALSKLITTSEAKNEQGFGANPFASSNAEVNVNTENKQLTETNRKLSNLISNKVANNIKATDIKACFIKTTQTKINEYGNLNLSFLTKIYRLFKTLLILTQN